MGLFVIPPLLIVVLMYLFLYSFRSPEKVAVIPLSICVTIFILIIFGVMWFASTSEIGTALTLIVVGLMTITIILAAIVLMIMLTGKRRLLVLALAIICPIFLFASVQIGGANTPEIIYKRNADNLINALAHYHQDNSGYPSSLTELVPNYIPDLKQPQRVWGWLYQTREDDFWLGYVEDVNWVGYSTSIYSSETSKWDYEPFGSGPFNLPPTPTSY